MASLLAVLSHYALELQLNSLSSKSGCSIDVATQQHTAQQSRTNTNADSFKPALVGNLPSGKSMHASRDQGRSASRDTALAAATALHNLLLDKGAQRLVCDLQGVATVAKLLLPTDWLLAARASGGYSMCSWSWTDVVLWSSARALQWSVTVTHDLLCHCSRLVLVAHTSVEMRCKSVLASTGKRLCHWLSVAACFVSKLLLCTVQTSCIVSWALVALDSCYRTIISTTTINSSILLHHQALGTLLWMSRSLVRAESNKS